MKPGGRRGGGEAHGQGLETHLTPLTRGPHQDSQTWRVGGRGKTALVSVQFEVARLSGNNSAVGLSVRCFCGGGWGALPGAVRVGVPCLGLWGC